MSEDTRKIHETVRKVWGDKMIYGTCELCYKVGLLTVHHHTPNRRKDPNNKKHLVCGLCHIDIQHLDNDKFFRKYHVKRSKFIRTKEM